MVLSRAGVPEDGGQFEGVSLLLEAKARSSVTQGQTVLSQLLQARIMSSIFHRFLILGTFLGEKSSNL
jgi:hypothetical protein